MGEQRNLTGENVEELRKHLEAMKEKNTDLRYSFFEQSEKDEQPSNKEIFEKMEEIESLIRSLILKGE